MAYLGNKKSQSILWKMSILGVSRAGCQMFPNSPAVQAHDRMALFVPFEVGWDHTLILANKSEQK